jgi:hypothetical protein
MMIGDTDTIITFLRVLKVARGTIRMMALGMQFRARMMKFITGVITEGHEKVKRLVKCILTNDAIARESQKGGRKCLNWDLHEILMMSHFLTCTGDDAVRLIHATGFRIQIQMIRKVIA